MQTDTLNSQTPPGTKRTSSPAIVILADDLTGACDSGVAFLACGRPVRVMLHPPARGSRIEDPGGEEDVVSYTTETRNLPENQATARVAEAMATLSNAHPNAIFFKKVDSAARGNFGAETIAAFQASGAALALVAPAFPQAGRTVHSGVLSVRDCGGQNSRIALRDQFPGLDSARIEVLRTGSEAQLQVRIGRAIANGIGVLICDGNSQEDLQKLAAAGRQVRHPLLWVGSAGLARALAGALPASTFEPAEAMPRQQGQMLLFSGSTHPVTRLQLSRLEEQAPRSDHAVVPIEFGTVSQQDIRQAFTSKPVSALILTGGDTAAFVLRSLEASGIRLAGELAPGIPSGFVAGGMADGCMVITKSGGFGDPNALVHALEFCARRPL